MEFLFTAKLLVDNLPVLYQVSFDHEQYVFLSESENRNWQRFSLRREQDQWVVQNEVPEDISRQAIEALENYLLKQH